MLQIRADAVERPGSTRHIIHHLEAAGFRISKRAAECRISALAVGKRGTSTIVGNQRIFRKSIDRETRSVAFRSLGGSVPIHTATVHIQRTATITKGKVALNLVNTAYDHLCPVVSQHIVSRVAAFPIQINRTAAAKVKQHIIISLPLNIQMSGPGLAPFAHIISRIGQLQMHLCPLINHIAGMVEKIILTCCRNYRILTPTKRGITYAKIHRIIQNNPVLPGRCGKQQVFREKQLLCPLQQTPAVCIPVLRILQIAQISPGIQATPQATELLLRIPQLDTTCPLPLNETLHTMQPHCLYTVF